MEAELDITPLDAKNSLKSIMDNDKELPATKVRTRSATKLFSTNSQLTTARRESQNDKGF